MCKSMYCVVKVANVAQKYTQALTTGFLLFIKPIINHRDYETHFSEQNQALVLWCITPFTLYSKF